MPQDKPSVGRRVFSRTIAKTLCLQRIFLSRVVGSALIVLSLLAVMLFGAFSGFAAPQTAIAQAPNTTLNFQARILNLNGSLVPDGDYHIEFKIYDTVSSGGTAQGACSGNCLWMETRTGGDVIRVVNGYVSANLGSVTSFPGNMPWGNNLYVTMRVGGAGGSPSWDTQEMTNSGNRMKMSVAPVAFVANNVASGSTNSASTNSSTISIQSGNALGTTSNSGNITIDTGTATGTAGTIVLGATNASALTLGRTGLTTTNAGALTVTQALTAGSTLTLTTLGATDTASFICRNSSNLLAGCNFTPLSSAITDNTADAFDLQEGTNNYININTTNSSENISFGNATTNPSYNFLGSGTLAVAGSQTIGGNLTVGSAPGVGVFTNNGATVNSTLAVSDDVDGGVLGGGLAASASVDVYTSISVAQTTASQTITLPTPTASTTYGRILYLSNVGSASFTFGSTTVNPGTTATLIWSNTNGGASWQFAGADGNGILNQNASAQTANFRISGSGQADTGLISPSVERATAGTLSVGTTANTTGLTIGGSSLTGTLAIVSGAASTINIGQTASARTINIGTGAAVQGITVGSTTGASALTLQSGTGALNIQTQGTGGINIATNAVAQTVTIGNSTGATSVVINAGTGAINIGTNAVARTTTIGNTTGASALTLNSGTGAINIGTGAQARTTNIATGAAAQTVVLGSTNTTSTTTIAAGSGNLNFNASQAQFSEVTGTRTLTVQTRTTNVAGTNLTLSGGTAGTGASAFTGGTLTLQGGNAAGTGNASGANVVLRGGTGVGSGVSGIVEIDTPVFTAAGTQSFGTSGTITQSVVDGNSTIPIDATAGSLTVTLPSPTNTTVGRIIYVTAVSASNSFTIAPSGGTNFVMSANSTATFVWNGAAWTNAGVDGGSASYIQNQNASDQTANFRISGTGRAAVALQAPLIDTATAAALNIGTTNATSIVLDKNTSLSGSTTFTTGTGASTISGTLAVTGSSTFNNSLSVSGANTLTVGTGATTLGGNLAVDTSTLYVNATSDFVNIGSASDEAARFAVIGANNETQLLVRASGSQTVANPLVLLQNSSSAELARINATTSSLYFGNAAGGNSAAGANNTGIGASALGAVSTGTANTTLGSGALASVSVSDNNTAVGYNAGNLATGGNNIFLGALAGDNVTTGTDNIIIGYNLDASGSGATNELRIGGVLQGNTSTLAAQFNGTLAVATLGSADTSTFLCRNTSNQLATCSTTPLINSLTDNIADAFDLQEGTNNYFNINTTNSSENISFGNATTNPSYNFLGTGALTVDGDLDVASVFTVQNVAFNPGDSGGSVDVLGNLNISKTTSNDYGSASSSTLLIEDPTLDGQTFEGSRSLASVLSNSNSVDLTSTVITGSYGEAYSVAASETIGFLRGVSGVAGINAAGGTIINASALYAMNADNLAGTITNGYGLYVENQTSATNDYGIYVAGADTYALFVDAGATRLDGTLEVQGLATLTGGLTVEAGDNFTFNSDVFTDFTGGGLVNTGGVLSVDTTTATGFFQNGGNAFAADATLGINANYALNIETNSLTRLTVEADGDVVFDTSTLFVDAANNQVSLGTTSNLGAKLAIVGSSDQEQLLIRANASQTLANPLIVLQNSAGTELARINVDGSDNIAFGLNTLDSITAGANNIGIGANTLGAVTTGGSNIAIGGTSQQSGTGSQNVSLGVATLSSALFSGSWNTAIGDSVLAANTTGVENTAVGRASLGANQDGAQNTAVGNGALGGNISGAQNTSVGNGAGSASTGGNNVFLGYNAGSNLTSGGSNILIGSGVAAMSTTGSSQLNIGDSLYGDLANDRLSIGNTVTSSGRLSVDNAATTDAIFVAKDNGTAVFTIGDNGATVLNPTANSVVALTVNGTTGTAATAVAVVQAGAASALSLTANGITTQSASTITSTGVLTTTGNLLALTANSATTSTGVLTVNATALTSGYAQNINVNGATSLTTGGALNIVGPTGAANLTSGTGLLRVAATGAFTTSAGVGGLLQVSTATVTGTAASIVGTGAMTTTGNLLTLTANSATTATGLLTVNGTALTTGAGITVNVASTANAISAGGNVTFQELTGTRTLGVQARTSGVAGTALTVQAGAGGAGAGFVGGALTLQGGSAGGTNANGGNVALVGGVGTGSGVKGLVVADTFALSTATVQTFGTLNGTTAITQSNVDSFGAVLLSATNKGITFTLGDPTLGASATGRLIYITNSGTNDFTLSANAGVETITLKPSTTATMIWNGSDWTAAGASSATDLQAAYDNTATNAGGAELVLNASGGAADGLTIRNNGTTPIIGGLLEVQSSIGSNLFTVNNNATEFANNGGAESATFTMWTGAFAGGTVTRNSPANSNVATGQGSVSVVTGAVIGHGAENTLTAALTPNLKYAVAYTVKGNTNFSTLETVYSRDGTNTSTVSCNSAQTVTTSQFTRINCTFTAPSSGIIAANSIFIRQTDASIRTFFIDNLSVTVSADVNHGSDGSVDLALGTNWTDFGANTAGTTAAVRNTSVLYDTSGSVEKTTGATADRGIVNNLSINPAVSTQYLVTFYARSSNTFNDIRVRYSRDGGTNFVSCVDYNTQSLSTTAYTRITCIITTDGSAPSNPDLVIDQPTATARTFYVDALTMTLNTNNSNNVQIGGGNRGGPTTLFTLDRAAGNPIAANNDAYLGSMYYDTITGRIQCYEADGWGACGAAPDNIVNLNPEYAGAVLNGSGVGTMTADFCATELVPSTVLSVNTALCAEGEARNYYKWTSPQLTQQTYSVYVTYQLPATFNGFSSDDTIQLTARTDSTTNAAVTYEVFRSTGSAVSACGTETTVVTTANTWQSVGINGNEATGCGFNSSAAGNFVIFKINMKANTNASAYVSTLSFVTTGR